jgi:phosphopantothenoylcysteine decarboxylase/phosphopantothenate--cysteine ligase
MGIALADEAQVRGYDTVFIHGPMDEAILLGKKYRIVSVETTMDLLHAVMKEITPQAVLVMAAAPADYTPLRKAAKKIKKRDEELVLHLRKNPDILRKAASLKDEPGHDELFLVGFAAETNDTERYALKKLREKNLDMICLNDVSRNDAGFGTSTNAVTIFMRGGEKVELPLLPKTVLAGKIWDKIEGEIKRRHII